MGGVTAEVVGGALVGLVGAEVGIVPQVVVGIKVWLTRGISKLKSSSSS